MKTIFLASLLFAFTLQSSPASAQGLRDFLKTCAWGSAFGVAAGVVSLAVSEKPSESWNNVAKGASLGLYAGIGYGLYQLNRPAQTYHRPDFAIIPRFSKDQKLEGVEVTSVLWSF